MKYTVDEVRAIIESAGKTTMMLPAHGTRPMGYRSGLPEHMIEFSDLIGNPKQNKITIRATQEQMTEFDMVQKHLPKLATYCMAKQMPYVARAVIYGMLHYPDTGRRVYNWRKLGDKVTRERGACSRHTAKNWYENGIEIFTKILNGNLQQNQTVEDEMSSFTWRR